MSRERNGIGTIDRSRDTMCKKSHLDHPVFITGVPRSGTSMVAGMLEACGLWLGPTVPGNADNPKGYFENLVLRDNLQKEILLHSGFHRLGVTSLPPAEWQPDVPNMKAAVAHVLTAQGYDGSRPWGFKDAKLALTWRLWHAHFPGARWVVVRRKADDIVASCLRTGFMNQHSNDRAFWCAFVQSYEARLERLRATVAWSRNVHPAQLVAGDFVALKWMVVRLGLAWREDAVRRFVAPELWHAPAELPGEPRS